MARKSKPDTKSIQAQSKNLLKSAKAEATWWKKLSKRQSQEAAKEKAKEIRRYMSKLKTYDLRKELTKSQINYINKAFEEYTALTSRPFKVYRSRKKANVKKVQEFARHAKGAPRFDVAFVPTIDPKNTRVRVKGNEIVVRNRFLTQRAILFNMRALASDPQREINRALAEHPNADSFIIMAGEYQFNGGLSRGLVEKRVLELMMRYSPGGKGFEARGPNSFYQNWLFGLEAYYYQNQDDFDNYRIEYRKERERTLNERRNERNRFQRKYGKRINVFKK